MKRRDFFKKGVQGAVAATILPVSSMSASEISNEGHLEIKKEERSGADIIRKKTLDYEVVVVGGGVAGVCAAVSAARNGAKTILVQDRPVLGGNASSEIRVHLNGVTHLKDGRPERETGVVEEILLHNRFHNPQESYPVWDHILYDYVTATPNLKVILNTSAIEATTKSDKITSVRCWQLTTETEITINGEIFIDCSGDGLMAATAGALFRSGREGKAEFNEKYAPDEPDGWKMGATILLSCKDMGKPMPYEAPHFTIPYDYKNAHKHRKLKHFAEGVWWVEVGSDKDIIGEFEENREKLMGYAYGVWDYIKKTNPKAENYALDWVCSLPGKRESRRFLGDYILSEPDLLGYKHFKDAVGYGGWSLDEHNPGGIENISEPPSYFHERFVRVYEIPYRSLYSKNIKNLLFAGRNISQTHIALSSTRLQGTCATMGQAVGTAAALCIAKNVLPRKIYTKYIDKLQEQLLKDDAYIPNRPAKDKTDLAKKVSAVFASSTTSGDAKLLIDGYSRDVENEIHHWQSDGLNANVQLEWDKPVKLSSVMVKCDTNTRRNLLMRKDSRNDEKFTNTVPVEMLKSLDLEVRINGEWVKVGENRSNRRRLIKFNFDTIQTTAIRLNLKETYGVTNIRLYEVRCYEA
ncbi:FAD-dependent oxidoreductase [Wenyingzhuangia sp. IMCC45574]